MERVERTANWWTIAMFAQLVGFSVTIIGCGEGMVTDNLPHGETGGETKQGVAKSGRYRAPAEVRRAGQRQVGAFDYIGAGSTCSGRMLSGSTRLGRFLVDQFSGASHFQGYNCRTIRGGSGLSMHGTGRAVDVFVPTDGGQADNTLGDPIANYLIRHASELGVQFFIWDRSKWNIEYGGPKYYGGAHPHHEHLHIELTPEAARNLRNFPSPGEDDGCSGEQFFLTNGLEGGDADECFSYGSSGDVPLTCDWNGDGVDTVGIFRDGTFHLNNANAAGAADIAFNYGKPSDTPLCGDWDGDGIDTVGVWRNGTFYLNNSHGGGAADVSFQYGRRTDEPIVGDWNGDGVDTVGVHRDNEFHLRNRNSSGVGDRSFAYGVSTDDAVVGDWDGDGDDTVGLVRDGQFLLRNANTEGRAHVSFHFGRPADEPLTGDWNGTGRATVGILRD